MSIGYACLTVGVPNTGFKTCRKANATEEKLKELIDFNLTSLERLIDYNIKSNIKLFRISSDIIPFGSSPVNTLAWWELFKPQFEKIGSKIKSSGMRVSMHPGQYTVLNSPDKDVVSRAVEDLNYHTRFLDSLGVGSAHKIILHIGGVYQEKEKAMERFVENYQTLLSDAVKKRLVIENDDRSYTVSEVLTISQVTGAPVIYDNLHNAINTSDVTKDDAYWIELTRKTWKSEDGRQKIHYSQQSPMNRIGAHTQTIAIEPFLNFYYQVSREDLDIMLEVKDKNLSAVKCITATTEQPHINLLEKEWSLYKYSVLERSPKLYDDIRQLLKDKSSFPVLDFYQLLDQAIATEVTTGTAVNAASHVYGYFKKEATEKEKAAFLKQLEKVEQSKGSIKALKKILWNLAVLYNQPYLLQSYYFVF
ncbi:UV DNA damage repair endonuclease UvsE [Carnobacterium viridans]|uniref:UV-damage endonuclease n=1 Tax=Carnobacterium viridans TaxID=174587 RepID=A0A1H1B5P8_9LACT|nr:UV DNA damage repair endonuclease UvsE [Carnobacterium viridans]UDE95918.1 UV DNA damage repair endonuclease UvsE [Carnobacterium viridans]SDQ47247.1 UV-damage endonuclease [Carnobacterium viridans]